MTTYFQNLTRLLGAVLLLTASLGARADVITYYFNDLLGSPRTAYQGTQQVSSESYLPYGERWNNTQTNNNVWYTSRYQDYDSGIVYMGARHYDPMAGRFLSVDPAGFNPTNTHSFNRYAYANNNPYRYFDRNGRDADSWMTYASTFFDPYLAAFGLSGMDGGRTAKAADTVTKDAKAIGKEVAIQGALVVATEGVSIVDMVAARTVTEGGLNLAEQIGILRDASTLKGNFALGRATATDADVLGKAWVGDGYRISKDGSAWVSKDELRVYRPPSEKPNSPFSETGTQANFERKELAGSRPIGNGHLDVTP